MPSLTTHLMTDFSPPMPPPPATGSSYSGASSYTRSRHTEESAGGGILVLVFGAVTGLGYILVQLLGPPEANEILIWVLYGLFAVGTLFAVLLAFVVLVWGFVTAFNWARRTLGAGLIGLGTWMSH